MPLAQGDDDSLVRRSSLQFDIERRTKSFSERQPQRTVEPPAERCVQDQLHPAALVEEPFGKDRLLSWHCSQDGATG